MTIIRASRRPRSAAAGSVAYAHGCAGQQRRRLDHARGRRRCPPRTTSASCGSSGWTTASGASVAQPSALSAPVITSPPRRCPPADAGQRERRVGERQRAGRGERGQEPPAGPLQVGELRGGERGGGVLRAALGRAPVPPQPVQVPAAAARRAARASWRRSRSCGRTASWPTARAPTAGSGSWPAASGCRGAAGPAARAPRPSRRRSASAAGRPASAVVSGPSAVRVTGGVMSVIAPPATAVMIRAIRGPAWPSHSGGQLARVRAVVAGLEHRGGQLVAGDEPVGAAGDGDRPLGVGPQGEAGHAQQRSLLLHAARIGHDRRRAAHQRHELDVAERVDHVDPRRVEQTRPRSSVARPRGCSGMITSSSAATSCSALHQLGGPLGRVDVRRPVQGGDHVPPVPETVGGAGRGGVELVQVGEQRVDHRVADEVHGAGRAGPRAPGARAPRATCTNSRSHSWSVSRRLISSGIVLSKLRSPASTCASGTPSFAPASDGADRRVHVAVQRPRATAASRGTPAPCRPDVGGLRGLRARPDAEVDVRLAAGRAGRRKRPTSARRSAARCAPRAARGRARRSARITGAALTKFGLAPSTCVIVALNGPSRVLRRFHGSRLRCAASYHGHNICPRDCNSRRRARSCSPHP